MVKSPTDVLIEAMSNASKMNFVVVVSAGPIPTTADAIGRELTISASGDPDEMSDAAKALVLLEKALDSIKSHLLITTFDTSEDMPSEEASV